MTLGQHPRIHEIRSLALEKMTGCWAEALSEAKKFRAEERYAVIKKTPLAPRAGCEKGEARVRVLLDKIDEKIRGQSAEVAKKLKAWERAREWIWGTSNENLTPDFTIARRLLLKRQQRLTFRLQRLPTHRYACDDSEIHWPDTYEDHSTQDGGDGETQELAWEVLSPAEAEAFYHLKKIEAKPAAYGKGVYAKRDIAKGECVLREGPTMFIPDTEFEFLKSAQVPRNMQHAQELAQKAQRKFEGVIRKAYDKLSSASQKEFLKGQKYYKWLSGDSVPGLPPITDDFLEKNFNTKLFCIYNANQFHEYSPDDDFAPGSAVYLNGLRFNHSCGPNVYRLALPPFDAKQQWFIATRDIKRGEELTITYVNSDVGLCLSPLSERASVHGKRKSFAGACVPADAAEIRSLPACLCDFCTRNILQVFPPGQTAFPVQDQSSPAEVSGSPRPSEEARPPGEPPPRHEEKVVAAEAPLLQQTGDPSFSMQADLRKAFDAVPSEAAPLLVGGSSTSPAEEEPAPPAKKSRNKNKRLKKLAAEKLVEGQLQKTKLEAERLSTLRQHSDQRRLLIRDALMKLCHRFETIKLNSAVLQSELGFGPMRATATVASVADARAALVALEEEGISLPTVRVCLAFWAAFDAVHITTGGIPRQENTFGGGSHREAVGFLETATDELRYTLQSVGLRGRGPKGWTWKDSIKMLEECATSLEAGEKWTINDFGDVVDADLIPVDKVIKWREYK